MAIVFSIGFSEYLTAFCMGDDELGTAIYCFACALLEYFSCFSFIFSITSVNVSSMMVRKVSLANLYFFLVQELRREMRMSLSKKRQLCTRQGLSRCEVALSLEEVSSCQFLLE